jgi:hypothetical protein
MQELRYVESNPLPKPYMLGCLASRQGSEMHGRRIGDMVLHRKSSRSEVRRGEMSFGPGSQYLTPRV